MLGLEEVTYMYATITCDWPACTNRANFTPGPRDARRERADMSTLRNLASDWGWLIDDGPHPETICPYHNQKEMK